MTPDSTSDPDPHPTLPHLSNLRHALTLARTCPPTTTAFSVGALLLSPSGTLLSTGYSRELPGNTHAEQCALAKLASPLPSDAILYTTMEPCSERLSGNLPCVDRIISAGNIKTVYVGVKEPDTFVKDNVGRRKLREAGIAYVYVPGLEEEILEAAFKGHGGEEGGLKDGRG
ncbi:DRAP deaminase [Rhizina undulata]